ncbi:MAG: dihydrolipoyllysine-residue acetyltransferase [Xanthomonadales bacterium]|nr:dihydrolipoyllysine-residue acetyltransferase [Xanthomonadales bacterium]
MPQIKEATVPDIGGFEDVPVIELLVAVGDTVKADQGLVTLESDKATMEVPAPFAGVIKELKVAVGDGIGEGSVVAMIEVADEDGGPDGDQDAGKKGDDAKSATEAKADTPPADAGKADAADTGAGSDKDDDDKDRGGKAKADAKDDADSAAASNDKAQTQGPTSSPPVSFDADQVAPAKVPYASPAVRAFARELGVDLAQVKGSARGGRISREDVSGFVKSALAGDGAGAATARAGGGLDLLPWPKVDFSKFGEIESKPLSRIKKISGANLARNWAMIPHVTQFDEADITGLEALRVQLNKEHAKAGIKLTLLAFLMKAVVAGLKKFPEFNASLDADGEALVLKKYFHIGFAADTPNGLVVPVIRDVDRKGIIELAEETSELAAKARDGKLGPAQMSGGCFSISSLGGIGGTAFTPIINAPEVAILGVSRSAMKPVWNGDKFKPRLMLPMSLSYDHRVIDGAAAARFSAWLAQVLADMRRVLL